MKGDETMLNQLVVIGRLTKDPELRQTENGKNVTNITLAVPRSYKNSNKLEYMKKMKLRNLQLKLWQKKLHFYQVKKQMNNLLL